MQDLERIREDRVKPCKEGPTCDKNCMYSASIQWKIECKFCRETHVLLTAVTVDLHDHNNYYTAITIIIIGVQVHVYHLVYIPGNNTYKFWLVTESPYHACLL